MDASVPDGGDGTIGMPFNAIQDAVDAAQEGDTIQVADGQYYENVEVWKELSIHGNGASRTFIDGENGIGILITADNIELSGFGITGEGAGTGVRLESNFNTISNTYIWDMHNGIVLYSAENNTVEWNNCSGNNYGIVLEGSSYNTIENNELYDNTETGIFFAFGKLNHNIISDSNEINGVHPNFRFNEHGTDGNPKKIADLKDSAEYGNITNLGFIVLYQCSYFEIKNIEVSHLDQGIIVESSDHVDITTSVISGATTGILIRESSEVTVANNQIKDGTIGIHLESSFDSTVESNNCSNDQKGILLEKSLDNTLEKNVCSFNDQLGIQLRAKSSDNILLFNNCSSNDNGIEIQNGCDSIDLVNNECYDNFYGISLQSECKNATVSSNTCSVNTVGIILDLNSADGYVHNNTCDNNLEAGIQIVEGSDNGIVENNECDDNAIGIRLGGSTNTLVRKNVLSGNIEFGVSIDEGILGGNVIAGDNMINGRNPEYHYSESGSKGSPVIIKDLTDSEEDRTMTNLGFLILFDCSFFTVRNLILSHSERGINVDSSSDIEIEVNSITSSTSALSIIQSNNVHVGNNSFNGNTVGITLVETEDSTLFNNTCNGNSIGIQISGSDNNVLEMNTCDANLEAGLALLTGSDHNSIVSYTGTNNGYGLSMENNCTGNSIIGVVVTGNTQGIALCENSTDNSITDSRCDGNEIGIALHDSPLNDVRNTSCSLNSETGILLESGSDENEIIESNCSQNGYGIFLSKSRANTIDSCVLDDNSDYGIYLQHDDLNDNILIGNHFNGNLPYLFKEVHGTEGSPVRIGDLSDSPEDSKMINLGYVIIIDSSFIEVQNITVNLAEKGVYIERSADISVEGSSIHDIRSAVIIRDSTDVVVNRCTLEENLNAGIDVRDSDGIVIKDNQLDKNDVGISVVGGGVEEGRGEVAEKRGEFEEGRGDGDPLYTVTISNNSCGEGDIGISLEETGPSLLDNNTCNENQQYGIKAVNVGTGLIIENSTCWANRYDGIHLESIDGFILSNNTCEVNFRNGIILYGSCFNGTIIGNMLGRNKYGINLTGNCDLNRIRKNTCIDSTQAGIVLNGSSDNNTISWNTISDNALGIYLLYSSDNIIDNNTMDSNDRYGIKLEDRILNDNIISDSNLIDGVNPIIFFKQHGTDGDPIRIGDLHDEAGHAKIMNIGFIVIYQCSYLMVENITIDHSEMGIFVVDSDHIAIDDVNITGISVGVMFERSEFCTVSNGEMKSCGIGLYFLKSWWCEANGNVVMKNGEGILLDRTENSTFSWNDCSENDNGIRLYQSSTNLLMNNSFNRNTMNGIQVEAYTDWNDLISLFHIPSFRNTIVGNEIRENSESGVLIQASYNTTILENEIIGNGYGIRAEQIVVQRIPPPPFKPLEPIYFYSRHTSIHNNTITGNTVGASVGENGKHGINAVLNWWGSGTGPSHAEENPGGTGQPVTDYVEFNPWIGKPKTVYNTQQDEFYYTIQEAVDLASDGDTIHVHEGVYIEEVVVHRPVTIVGNGTEKTIIRTKAPYRYISLGCPYQMRITGDGVTVSGMTFQGNGNSTTGIQIESSYNRVFNTVNTDSNHGIVLSGAADTIIENNSFSGAILYGINILKSQRVTITGNAIDSGVQIVGINILKSTSNTITGNGIKGQGEFGIKMKYAHDTTIGNNSIVDCSNGIECVKSNYNVISGNTITGCAGQGITFDSSIMNEVQENWFEDDTIGILSGEDSSYITITSNSFVNIETGMSILYGGNISVIGNSFDGSVNAIQIRSSNGNRILKNTCENGENGIFLYGSSGNTIERNICSDNAIAGINLTYVTKSTISLNLLGPGNGIGLSMKSGANCVVVNNTIFENGIGILAVGSFSPTAGTYNNIIDNGEFGIQADDNNGHDVDAANSYWGDPSGPSHPTANPSGQGDTITDNVEFQPYSDTSLVFAAIDSIIPEQPEDGDNVTFTAYGYSHGHEIVRYEWWSSIDGDIYAGNQKTFTTADLTNGTHRIHLRVKDARDIWSRPAGTILRVNGKPRVDLDDLPRWILEGDDVLLKGNVYDDGEIALYVYSSSHEGLLYQGTDPEFLWKGPSWGERFIYFQVMDDLGTWSDVARADFGVYSKPKAFIDTIRPREAMYGEPILFSGHGVDDIGVANYLWRDVATGNTLSTSSEFTNSGFANGTHEVEFRVRNSYGVWSDWDGMTFSVNGIPVAEILDINPNPATSGDLVEFHGIGYDDSKIKRYLWQSDLDGEIYNGTESSFSTYFLSFGTHSINLTVMDDSLNWSKPAEAVLNFTMRPFATIESISPNPAFKNDQIVFVANWTDDGTIMDYLWTSDIDGIIYSGNLSMFGASTLSPGTHAIYLKVRDDQGVWSEDVSTTIQVVNNARPMIYILEPGNNETVNDVVTIKGTTWDDDETKKIEYKVLDGKSGWKIVTTNLSQWSIEWDSTKVSNGNRSIAFRTYDGTVYSSEIILTLKVDNEGGLPSIDSDPDKSFLDTWLPFILIFLLSSIVIVAMFFLMNRKGKKKQDEDTPVDDKPMFRDLPIDMDGTSDKTQSMKAGNGKKSKQAPREKMKMPPGKDGTGEEKDLKVNIPAENSDGTQNGGADTVEGDGSPSPSKTPLKSPPETPSAPINEKPLESKHDDTFSRKE